MSTTEVRRHVSSTSTLETLQFHFTDLSSDCCLAAMLGNLSHLRTLKTPESEAVTAELVSQVAQLTALQDLDLSSEYVSSLCVLLFRWKEVDFLLLCIRESVSMQYWCSKATLVRTRHGFGADVKRSVPLCGRELRGAVLSMQRGHGDMRPLSALTQLTALGLAHLGIDNTAVHALR